MNDANKDNTLVKLFVESGLTSASWDGYAIQGELMDQGIQCNREALKAHCYYIRDVQNLTTGTYLRPGERVEFIIIK